MTTELPYNGTMGHSGSAASQERAEREATDGTASARQRMTRSALHVHGSYGLTWRELGECYGWHHGQASAVLSVLHKTGQIARLKDERRDRCSVYVMPEFVEGRNTAPHGGNRPADPAPQAFTPEQVAAALDSRADLMGIGTLRAIILLKTLGVTVLGWETMDV